ncbi:hypothetical protein SAMN04489712_13835 [Thermomonospora echinospora]|uniref:Uncharacterized protein n=1 Tax=Thermomonospora echinospora TaxID=1992 RepID=A0A1H6E946_9ACTN|nr:hypothetical protein SAMN04489712_13835 [Thermomonospora echinospora]
MPRLAAPLREAQRRREKRAAGLVSDIRLSGINDLLIRLDDLIIAFIDHPSFKGLAFLLRRSAADFETALEATISGYSSVAFDAMRDVLEIEYLLRDFALDPANITNWLDADQKTLKKYFSPVKVRERLKTAGIGNFGENAESRDYRAHSMSLHLSPHRVGLLPGKGLARDRLFPNDFGFWEIFLHAHGLISAIRSLTEALAPESEVHHLASQDSALLAEARKDVQHTQELYYSMFEARNLLRGNRPGEACAVLSIALRDAGAIRGELLTESKLEAFYDEAIRVAQGEVSPAQQIAVLLVAILNSTDGQ